MKTSERDRAVRRARYAKRKQDQVCVFCAAGLQEDDGLLCVECTGRSTTTKRDWRRTKGRAKENLRTRARYQERKAQGLCRCGRSAVPGKSMCVGHVMSTRENSRKWWRLNKGKDRPQIAKVIPIGPRITKRKGPVSHGITEIREYQPIDEMAQTPRVRILLALAWLEWTSVHDLFAHLRVDTSNQGDNREYDNHMQMLSRLARWGIVDRRGKRNGYEYQINDEGRAEVARIRGGDLRVRFRRRAA